MATRRKSSGLAYSARVVEPFLEVVADALGSTPAEAAERLAQAMSGERVAIESAHQWLQAAVELTGDPALGLKAGRSRSPGAGGAFEYAMHSAATVADALKLAARHTRLVNDALEMHLERHGDRALLRLESHVPLPAAAEDFLMAVMYTLHMARLLDRASDVQCWFVQPAPSDPSEHRATFAPATLRFGAPSSGFSFDAAHLEQDLPSADPGLNAILTQHIDRTLQELPAQRSVALQVRRLVAQTLPAGQPSVNQIAKKLALSSRTLARRLEAEGESFGSLLDDTRRRLALRHLDDDTLSMEEITFLLGFSQTPVFHRAFRRWTGKTPREYRRELRAARRSDEG